MATKELARQEENQVQNRTESGNYLVPPVTVYENDQGLTLHADLPGVSKERVRVEVEQDNLTLEAELAVNLSENMQAVHAELQNARFRRVFSVSSELDTQNIKAEMKDGVLTLQIPKKPSARPQKIEIK